MPLPKYVVRLTAEERVSLDSVVTILSHLESRDHTI